MRELIVEGYSSLSRRTENKMRYRIQASLEVKTDESMRLPDLLGPGVRAWVFGAVAKGTQKAGGVLNVYVSGPAAEKLEAKFFGKRPAVTYEGKIYPMRLIGPTKIEEAIFVKEHPEAIEIRPAVA
jgi:hypothetical protein